MDAQTLNPLTEQQILDAVAALQPESVAMLADLVAEPRCWARRQSAQALMKRRFEGLGLAVSELVIDEAEDQGPPGLFAVHRLLRRAGQRGRRARAAVAGAGAR
jgi:hypothetical protein